MKTMELLTSTKGDENGKIDDLINFLVEQKTKGATHYRMRWSKDPIWSFKWFETFKLSNSKEETLNKIQKLKKELLELEHKAEYL